jgi:hypothetical protein
MRLGLGLNLTRAGGVPFYADATVALDFANNRYRNGLNAPVYADPSLVSGWSFSRTGVEYALNSAGLLVPFSSGTPAITDLGLQAWEARTNLSLRSQQLSNAAWAVGAATAADNVTAAPDSTATGASLIETTAASTTHTINYSSTIAVTATNVYTYSIFAKPNGRSKIVLVVAGADLKDRTFDLSNGTSAVGPGSATPAHHARQRLVSLHDLDVGGGHIRPATANRAQLRRRRSAGVYVWGGQLELGAFPAPTSTTSASATRGAASASVPGLSLAARFHARTAAVPTRRVGMFPVLARLTTDADNNRVYVRTARASTTVSVACAWPGRASSGHQSLRQHGQGAHFATGLASQGRHGPFDERRGCRRRIRNGAVYQRPADRQ